MSSKANKRARNGLTELFGEGCFIERAGIREITPEQEEEMRRTIKGFKKLDRTITYHHLKPKSKGGKATIENGANVARYNHDWLEQLPPEKREHVNNLLRKWKINCSVMQVTDKGLEIKESQTIEFGGLDEEDLIVIPAYDNKPKQKYNRAKDKREIQKRLDDYWEDFDR